MVESLSVKCSEQDLVKVLHFSPVGEPCMGFCASESLQNRVSVVQ